MNSFIYHFRSLISQITRETEEGIAFAHSDDSGSSHVVDTLPGNESPELGTEIVYQDNQEDYDNEDGFYITSAPRTHGSYEQHQQYPAGEEIRMLNGFIRKLPTIESMGSHELQSSMGASSTNRDRERIGASSRPPTRNTLGSLAATDLSGTSEPRSRRNSLTVQAEVLAGKHHLTEIGEVIREGDTTRRVDNLSTNGDNSRSLGASTNSSSVLSYVTASGSIAKSSVIPLSDSNLSDHPNLEENSRRHGDIVNTNS